MLNVSENFCGWRPECKLKKKAEMRFAHLEHKTKLEIVKRLLALQREFLVSHLARLIADSVD